MKKLRLLFNLNRLDDKMLKSLENELIKNGYNKKTAKITVKHYRAFLLGYYSGYKIFPVEELADVQKIHKKMDDFKLFFDNLISEDDLIVDVISHQNILNASGYDRKQKIAKKTISFLKGFNLMVANNKGMPLRPIDIGYSRMPRILYEKPTP